ncbi:GNAT family N-acetyltransferase [Streptomyces sp. NPDC014748]|uniref:GNAT family N-acetyltransferase n=1 Tax=Streptomyces sp. NPDC014748 TaxID=3364905 RepID=UPI0036F9C485
MDEAFDAAGTALCCAAAIRLGAAVQVLTTRSGLLDHFSPIMAGLENITAFLDGRGLDDDLLGSAFAESWSLDARYPAELAGHAFLKGWSSLVFGTVVLTRPKQLRAFGIRVGGDEVLAGTVDPRFAGEGLAPGQVNVAYGLYPSWRGRGLATRAVLLATAYAAGEGGTEAVIQVEPGNPAAAAVALRAGFAPGPQTRSEDGMRFDWYVRDLRVAVP